MVVGPGDVGVPAVWSERHTVWAAVQRDGSRRRTENIDDRDATTCSVGDKGHVSIGSRNDRHGLWSVPDRYVAPAPLYHGHAPGSRRGRRRRTLTIDHREQPFPWVDDQDGPVVADRDSVTRT